jgi:hypothetical protein
MVLLPENLDYDPGLLEFQKRKRSMSHKCNAEGIRLWAKYFALPGVSDPVKIPSAGVTFAQSICFIQKDLNGSKIS